MSKELLKKIARMGTSAAVFPAALAAGFGRFEPVFALFAQGLAFVPGLPGSYLRMAYYGWTLEECGRSGHIAVGSFFAHPQASMGEDVGIGAYCVLGRVRLGDGTRIGSGAQVLSGTRQHARSAGGRIVDEGGVFRTVSIGPHCWIGAGSIVAANLGERVNVAIGSVVLRGVPDGATVAGNPAFNVAEAAPARKTAAATDHAA